MSATLSSSPLANRNPNSAATPKDDREREKGQHQGKEGEYGLVENNKEFKENLDTSFTASKHDVNSDVDIDDGCEADVEDNLDGCDYEFDSFAEIYNNINYKGLESEDISGSTDSLDLDHKWKIFTKSLVTLEDMFDFKSLGCSLWYEDVKLMLQKVVGCDNENINELFQTAMKFYIVVNNEVDEETNMLTHYLKCIVVVYFAVRNCNIDKDWIHKLHKVNNGAPKKLISKTVNTVRSVLSKRDYTLRLLSKTAIINEEEEKNIGLFLSKSLTDTVEIVCKFLGLSIETKQTALEMAANAQLLFPKHSSSNKNLTAAIIFFASYIEHEGVDLKAITVETCTTMTKVVDEFRNLWASTAELFKNPTSIDWQVVCSDINDKLPRGII